MTLDPWRDIARRKLELESMEDEGRALLAAINDAAWLMEPFVDTEESVGIIVWRSSDEKRSHIADVLPWYQREILKTLSGPHGFYLAHNRRLRTFGPGRTWGLDVGRVRLANPGRGGPAWPR